MHNVEEEKVSSGPVSGTASSAVASFGSALAAKMGESASNMAKKQVAKMLSEPEVQTKIKEEAKK